MPREWGQFWIAMSIMVLAGAIVFGAILQKPFNVGSIGQWASAMGTTLAVWVAVNNTNRTLQSTERRELEKQRVSDTAYVGAVISLAASVNDMIETIRDHLRDEELDPKIAREALNASNLEGLVAAIDRLPLHQAPDTHYIERLESVRTAAHNVIQILSDAAKADQQVKINIDQEFNLSKRALIRMRLRSQSAGYTS